MDSDPHRSPWAKAILDYLAQHPTAPHRPRQLARAMSIDSDDYLVFRRAVKELRRAGALRQGGFQESSKSTTGRRKARQIQGQFQATPRGFGFVTLPEEPGREDIYIPEEATGGAMHGDVVLVGARDDENDGVPQSGSAYVFRYQEGSWVEEAKLTAPDGGVLDLFGSSVAIKGNAAIVGARARD